ncbi:MFS transporter [Gordonia sp. HY285]|uniref:MFS transporter n=1 Tax=Gordonia liuliyuniae TaxID=2911517 RepID=UPI001F2B3F02|nr:MFS transporter [Gordonia liuliyuniae]MCF8610506.1 MFS transporter [Gordonia liuliyuniae]
MTPRTLTPTTSRERYLVLLMSGLPFLMMTLDGTIVNVALPSIARELGASLQSLQWIVSAYILVIAGFVLMSGMLADRFGRRRMLIVGVCVFTLGSVLCSITADETWLIATRAFQAIGAAVISPAALSLVTNTFTDKAERAKALGWWSVIASVGLALGPMLGGVLVQSMGWRSIFWVNVIPGIIAVVVLVVWAPESRADKVKPFDPVGQVGVVAFLLTLVFVIIESPRLGWTSPAVLTALAICAVSLIVLVLYERTKAEALIPFSLFGSRAFTTSILTLMLGVLGSGAVLFTATLYLQNFRGLSPIEAGLFILPMALASAVTAPLSGKFVAAGRTRGVLLVAALLISVAGVAFWITSEVAVTAMLVAFLLMGLGFGALNDPVNVVAISELPNDKAGLAASLISMGRQVGQVLGVAVAGALLANDLGADLKTGFEHAAVPTWILLIAAGAIIFMINVVPRRSPPVAARQDRAGATL